MPEITPELKESRLSTKMGPDPFLNMLVYILFCGRCFTFRVLFLMNSEEVERSPSIVATDEFKNERDEKVVCAAVSILHQKNLLV